MQNMLQCLTHRSKVTHAFVWTFLNDLFLIECRDQTYGAECKEQCGNCKYMEHCHHVDGICPSGCESGVYGRTCKQPCGNCSNGHLCNEVDGSCQFGCDVGVYGKTCSIGNTTYLSKRYIQSYRCSLNHC